MSSSPLSKQQQESSQPRRRNIHAVSLSEGAVHIIYNGRYSHAASDTTTEAGNLYLRRKTQNPLSPFLPSLPPSLLLVVSAMHEKQIGEGTRMRCATNLCARSQKLPRHSLQTLKNATSTTQGIADTSSGNSNSAACTGLSGAISSPSLAPKAPKSHRN